MMFRSYFFTFLAFFCLILSSCKDEVEHLSEDQIDEIPASTIKLSEELGLDSGEAKLFTMPTPLQVGSALSFMGVNYNGALLMDHEIVQSNSDVELSLALGMYMVDLGYVTVYNHPQKGMDYAHDVQKIIEELPIAYYVNDGFSKRFQSNLQNRDSLSKIILQAYNDANQYITETENEGIGLLILTGAYIETFYLAIHTDVAVQWTDEYTSMIIQQKQFLDNFLLLLEPYQLDQAINEVYQLLNELNTVFEGMDVKYNNVSQKYELSNPISPIQKKKMRGVLKRVRNQLIKDFQS